MCWLLLLVASGCRLLLVGLLLLSGTVLNWPVRKDLSREVLMKVLLVINLIVVMAAKIVATVRSRRLVTVLLHDLEGKLSNESAPGPIQSLTNSGAGIIPGHEAYITLLK